MKKLLSYFLIFLIVSLPLCFATEISYSYDANGNLIQDESSYYEYNGFDQLVRVRLGNSSGTILSEYLYNHEGNRILTIDYNGSANTSTFYPSDSFVQVVNQSGSYNTTYYYAGNILLATDNGSIAYYHPDHLGSTTLVTDGTGALLRETKYGPFGAVLSGGNDRYLYTGQEFDAVTDLYYYGARFYKPDYYHFTQPDIVIKNVYNSQNLNRYAYVKNNPYKYVDTTGLFAITLDLGGGAGGGPYAGSTSIHPGFSYSNKYGFEVGFYGSESFGWSYILGGEIFGGLSLTPSAEQFSDLFGESTTRGFSIAAGHGFSADKSTSKGDESIKSYSIAYSPGLSAEIHKFDTDSSGNSYKLFGTSKTSSIKDTSNRDKSSSSTRQDFSKLMQFAETAKSSETAADIINKWRNS